MLVLMLDFDATDIALPSTIQLTTISGRYIPSTSYNGFIYALSIISSIVTNVEIINIYTGISTFLGTNFFISETVILENVNINNTHIPIM